MADLKKTIPIFQSLTRPILMFGGERENIIIVVFVAGAVWFAGKDWFALGLASLIWGAGLILSRWAAKQDPYQTKIYLRSSRYESFYPAREKLGTDTMSSLSSTRKLPL